MIIRNHNEILGFLKGQTKDYRDRTFQDMLDLTDKQIEQCHDQIQYLFPLHEKSNHAHTYPIVDKELIEKSKLYPEIKANLLKALDRISKFFGISSYEDTQTQRKWCRDRNHNLLRITRIIRCLRLFGLDNYAKNFHEEVTRVGNKMGVSQITLNYWNKALNDNIWETLQ